MSYQNTYQSYNITSPPQPAGPTPYGHFVPQPTSHLPYGQYPQHFTYATGPPIDLPPRRTAGGSAVPAISGPPIPSSYSPSSSLPQPPHPKNKSSSSSSRDFPASNTKKKLTCAKDAPEFLRNIEKEMKASPHDFERIRKLGDANHIKYSNDLCHYWLNDAGDVIVGSLARPTLLNHVSGPLSIFLSTPLKTAVSTTVTLFSQVSHSLEVSFPLGACGFSLERRVRMTCSPSSSTLPGQSQLDLKLSFLPLPSHKNHSSHQFYMWICVKNPSTGDHSYICILVNLAVTPSNSNTAFQFGDNSFTNIVDIDVDTGLQSATFQDSTVLLKRFSSSSGGKALGQFTNARINPKIRKSMFLPDLGIFTSLNNETFEIYHIPHGALTLLQFITQQDDVERYWMYRIAEKLAGHLKSLSEAGFYHRDLNSSNIIVANHQGEFDVFIIGWDFLVSVPDLNHIAIGKYPAPIGHPSIRQWDSHARCAFDLRVDIFAFRALGLEMLCKSRTARGDKEMQSGALRDKTELPSGVLVGHLDFYNMTTLCGAPNATWDLIIDWIIKADPQRSVSSHTGSSSASN